MSLVKIHIKNIFNIFFLLEKKNINTKESLLLLIYYLFINLIIIFKI